MAGRDHIPFSGLKNGRNHESIDESITLHPHRCLTPAEVHIIEDRIATQSREIQTLLHDNQRLAAFHVALKQDVATAQQDLRRLSATASSIKAERDAEVREVYERSLKLEAEARSVDGLSADLDRVRAEIKELRDERKELSKKLMDIESEVSSTQPELQEVSDLKTEIEAWQREIRRGRAAIEYERKMSSNNFEVSEAMEKHMICMAREAEKLCTELANAKQRATTAVVAAALAANQGPGYAMQQPGFATQQPGYAIPQPGYAISQPGYVLQQTGYTIQQPGYPIQQPGYPIQQPGYGGNSLPDPHVVQPEYGGNTVPDPHVPQGDHSNTKGKAESKLSNKKGKAESKHLNKKRNAESKLLNKKRKAESKHSNNKGKAETNPKGKKRKCADCKKFHRGQCLKDKKVCFRCKEPGHMSYECTAFKDKEPEEKGEAGVIACTQLEVEHV